MWLSLFDVSFGDAGLLSIKTCKTCIQGIDAESEVFVIQSQTHSWYTVDFSGIMCWIWGSWPLAVGRHAHLEATTATFPRDVSSCGLRFFPGRFPRSRACANQLYLPKYETREVQQGWMSDVKTA